MGIFTKAFKNWKELLKDVPEIEPEILMPEIPAPNQPEIPAPETVPLEIPPPPKASEVVVPNKTEVILENVNTDSSVTYF